MKVHQIITKDEGITNPKRSTFGVTLAVRWGDVLHPLGSEGNWFKPPYFTRILRFYLHPFIAPLFLCLWAFGFQYLWPAMDMWEVAAYPLILLLTPGLFISWNLWGWRGYLGAKVYGADSPTYTWLQPEEVYPGSLAIHFSGRLRITD